MDAKKISLLEEFMKKNFESSDFDIFLLDKNGNIIISRFRGEADEISDDAITLLENCGCISSCFKKGEVEDFILHGKGGYIIAINLDPMILAASGIQESQIGETLKMVKNAAKLMEEKRLLT